MKRTGIACLLFLLACHNPSNQSPTPQPDSVAPVPVRPTTKDTTTIAGTWYLEPVPPSDSTGNPPWIHLGLELSRFNGYTGCNTMHGKFYYSAADSSISFGERIVVGRKFCQGYNEAAFIKGLKSTGRYRLQNGVLILMMDNHTELSRWRRGRPVSRKNTVT
ncbi:MAG TPA: META domain-containing protein [Puia sp.]|nr:META domain-containing protein [Puia sp.]